MNIILGDENIRHLENSYVVLELDRFLLPDRASPISSYCLVENVSISELAQIDHLKHMHEKLIENYRKKNWPFCEQTLKYLTGRWNGELDSFYQILADRVKDFKLNDPGENWDGTIVKDQ